MKFYDNVVLTFTLLWYWKLADAILKLLETSPLANHLGWGNFYQMFSYIDDNLPSQQFIHTRLSAYTCLSAISWLQS